MPDTSPRVLIVHATKNGSTAEIAEHIGEVLTKAACAVTVRPASDTRTRVDDHDAVVIGGGLYAGRWHRNARGFARRNARALRGMPVWLFSSGPLDASAAERDIPAVPGVRRIADRIDARGHITFGGRLDENARGRMARMIVNSGKGGDFRDFAQITAWAEGIARELRSDGRTGRAGQGF
ncbi:flavodoxin domain-containing protein [Streptomyces sp. NPDC006422]|uniref:flavodoxin domain-containing protein n=1 Tax=unclassified Streptomyces TaxID=2593676 RepID=UPI0033BA0B29